MALSLNTQLMGSRIEFTNDAGLLVGQRTYHVDRPAAPWCARPMYGPLEARFFRDPDAADYYVLAAWGEAVAQQPELGR